MSESKIPAWIEVSLTVDNELAEAVADVFSRFAPNGVMTQREVIFLNEEDHGVPSGPVVVRAYLQVDGRIESTIKNLEESLYYLGMIQPLPAAEYKQIANENWMEAWKKNYQPLPVGERLLIIPIWLDSFDPNRIPIKINPGMAFGTGTHPTTQLCLELIEIWFKQVNKDHEKLKAVIDIGCGSGILSIAALKLGAQTALGLDIEVDALNNAIENVKNNDLQAKFIARQGSVKEVLKGQFPCKSAPLVIANILAPIILRLFDDGLAKLVEPGGTLILGGTLLEQEQKILDTASANGLKTQMRKQIGDWVSVSLSDIYDPSE